MIAYLRGRIVSLESGASSASGQAAVLDVHGVGYKVRIPTGLYAVLKERLGERSGDGEVELHVFSRAQDDGVTLFGFVSVFERRVFERLLLVSGVGPSVALAILSAHRAEDLISAIASGDGDLFERVPRVGNKLASYQVGVSDSPDAGMEPQQNRCDVHDQVPSKVAISQMGQLVQEDVIHPSTIFVAANRVGKQNCFLSNPQNDWRVHMSRFQDGNSWQTQLLHETIGSCRNPCRRRLRLSHAGPNS